MKPPKERLHRVIVIGATPTGIAATNKLGEIGIPVTLVDSHDDLDRTLSADEWRMDSGVPFNYAHRPGLIRILRNPSIHCIMPAEVKSIKHSSQGFRVRLKKAPTYIDPDRCTLCGRCYQACPVHTSDGFKAIRYDGRMTLPGRPVIDKRRKPPCQENCPLGVNAQGYIALTRAEKFTEALALVRKDNVLAGICGRICTHPCEAGCRRGELDDPIAIRDIKRFLADDEGHVPKSSEEEPPGLKSALQRSEKIAVIGSGPSGLAAAAELAQKGYPVTAFEKENEPGGLLRYGIGPHRLPRHVLDTDLHYIRNLGVKFITQSPVNPDGDLDGLFSEYQAVILATGAWKDRKLGVPGEDLKGVSGCLSFLNNLYRTPISAFPEKTAVIGDGNAAFDLARTLKRLGAEVSIISWFPLNLIPADPEEIKAALEEKITIIDSLKVVRFKGKGGKLTGLSAMPTIPGPPDANGMPWPVIIQDGAPVDMNFTRAFVAIGQSGPYSHVTATTLPFEVSEQGFIRTRGSSRTSRKGLYAAGDTVTGPSSVVKAMAAGRMAARDVHEDLCGHVTLTDGPERPENLDFPVISEDIPALSRPAMPEKQLSARMDSFAEVALGLSGHQVVFEAERCLQCGVCSECLECVNACGAIQAVRHDDHFLEITEHAGVIIMADPGIAAQVKGEDVIRAYGPRQAKTDVNAMIVRGYAAAAKAMVLLAKTSQRLKGHGISFHAPDPGLSPEIRIGVFVCRCNDALGWLDGMTEYLQGLSRRNDIFHVEVLNSACTSEGYAGIFKSVREKGITRMVLASCVCCPLNFVCSACSDQRSRLKNGLFTGTGISRSMVETCNLRGEVLRLVGKDPHTALKRFVGLMDRSITRATKLKPLPSLARNYNFATAVIGESEAAVASARILAEAGLDIFLFGAKADAVNGNPAYPNVHTFENSEVKRISGTLGEFQLSVQTGLDEQKIQVGAIILGEKSRSKIRYVQQEELPSRTVTAALQQKGLSGIPFFAPGATSIKGLYLADAPGIYISKAKKGAAAAIIAAALMPRGPRQSKGFTVSIDENLCRGCGRCVDICPYRAITLQKNGIGGWHAVVDEGLCKGCGNCICNCPSNAADSPYRDQGFLEQSLEEILSQ